MLHFQNVDLVGVVFVSPTASVRYERRINDSMVMISWPRAEIPPAEMPIREFQNSFLAHTFGGVAPRRRRKDYGPVVVEEHTTMDMGMDGPCQDLAFDVAP